MIAFKSLFVKAWWCLVYLHLAARWSWARTLNYLAAPQQIEAVMCSTTWLASACTREHQQTGADCDCRNTGRLHNSAFKFKLMQHFGMVHNLLHGWSYFFLLIFLWSDAECVLLSHRGMRMINYSPDPAFMCECWASSRTVSSQSKQLSFLIDTQYLFMSLSNASH